TLSRGGGAFRLRGVGGAQAARAGPLDEPAQLARDGGPADADGAPGGVVWEGAPDSGAVDADLAALVVEDERAAYLAGSDGQASPSSVLRHGSTSSDANGCARGVERARPRLAARGPRRRLIPPQARW